MVTYVYGKNTNVTLDTMTPQVRRVPPLEKQRKERDVGDGIRLSSFSVAIIEYLSLGTDKEVYIWAHGSRHQRA